MGLCSNCGHDIDKKHCIGGMQHEHYGPSGSSSGVKPHAIIVCDTRHCNETMCTCIAARESGINSVFTQPKINTVWKYIIGGGVSS